MEIAFHGFEGSETLKSAFEGSEPMNSIVSDAQQSITVLTFS